MRVCVCALRTAHMVDVTTISKYKRAIRPCLCMQRQRQQQAANAIRFYSLFTSALFAREIVIFRQRQHYRRRVTVAQSSSVLGSISIALKTQKGERAHTHNTTQMITIELAQLTALGYYRSLFPSHEFTNYILEAFYTYYTCVCVSAPICANIIKMSVYLVYPRDQHSSRRNRKTQSEKKYYEPVNRDGRERKRERERAGKIV